MIDLQPLAELLTKAEHIGTRLARQEDFLVDLEQQSDGVLPGTDHRIDVHVSAKQTGTRFEFPLARLIEVLREARQHDEEHLRLVLDSIRQAITGYLDG